MKKAILMSIVLVLILSVSVQAAFIVEPYPGGLASDHFSHNGAIFPTGSTPSDAPGLTPSHPSIYGGSAVLPELDTYIYTYTPGTDIDNWDVPQFQYFGNGLYTTNKTGGQTGYYNVYITWPPSTGVSSLCDITVTSDGKDVVWNDVDMNTGGTIALADSWDHDPAATLLGGNDAWLKIADNILLTEGGTYTVTQVANENTFVSMRSAGVMWEFVEVPEPAAMSILGLGGLLLRRRK